MKFLYFPCSSSFLHSFSIVHRFWFLFSAFFHSCSFIVLHLLIIFYLFSGALLLPSIVISFGGIYICTCYFDNNARPFFSCFLYICFVLSDGFLIYLQIFAYFIYLVFDRYIFCRSALGLSMGFVVGHLAVWEHPKLFDYVKCFGS